MTDFLSLLKEQPETAIATRLDHLEEKAKAARLDIESAKLSSLALTLVGFGLSANPLVAVIGGIGALGYVGSLVTDYMATGRFCPVPALRKGVGELLSGFSSAGNDYDPDPDVAEVEALASCLPPREAKEFWLLSRNSERLLGHLLPVAPEQRLNAYGLAVRNPHVLGTVNPALPAVSTPTQALPPAPPESEQGTVGPNTRLGAIAVSAVPAQPVSPPPSPATGQWDEDEPLETTQGAHDLVRLRDVLGYPAVLIYGASGAGKSTMAQWFINERLKLGHTAEILDPHAAYGQWQGLPLYGAGLDYKACNERLGAFADLVQQRYQTLAKRPNFHPRPHTLLTEEFTNWASHCARSAGFFKSSMSDLRKVNMFALYVAHGRTLTALGGSSGTAQQRDASLLMIELDTKLGPDGRPCPAGRGRIYYPGRHDAPVEIVIPDLSVDCPQVKPTEQSNSSRSPSLETAYCADSSDEVIALVREVLIQADEPLLASVIRQKKNQLKERFTKEELEGKLQLMAMEGFVQATTTEPPRYTIP